MKRRSKGFTIIELLVVIGIIGLLIQLLLPAIEAAREAARKTSCRNNLKHIVLAFQMHHETAGHFPTSGWGWNWTGHPDRGFGKAQPGGWAYNILPFCDEQAIRDLGSGLPDGSVEKAEALLVANSTPIPIFNCPSRRRSTIYPLMHDGFSPILPAKCGEGKGSCLVTRGDYAANAGGKNERHPTRSGGDAGGPPGLDQEADWDWLYITKNDMEQNGISYQRSTIRMSEIIDGMSQTYCIGEKFLAQSLYKRGYGFNDDQGLFAGHDFDTNRHTGTFKNLPLPPLQDNDDEAKIAEFGSAHPGSWNVAFCDGSVAAISYDIDPTVHRLHGGRNDGEVAVAK
jgi:prepilin-type N-terminal cleavage/methylation domain-containing protein/prepilin-type processing-associated H-X9-DG protein